MATPSGLAGAVQAPGLGSDNLEKLYLLPYPRSISLKGAPMRTPPSVYLYLSASASPTARRKCQILAQQLGVIGFRTQIVTAPGLQPTQALFTAAATFQKWPQMDRPLRGEVAKPEGYRLTVTSEGALLHGTDDQGLLYAGYTLKQLLEDNSNVPGMEIEDAPLVPMRVIHLDFKGWPPTIEHLKNTISQLASYKINSVILEYEAYFNFPSQPGLAADGAITSDQVAELDLFAQDVGVTLIPLVPCLGNVSHILKLPAYQHLREHPDYTQQLCPVNPASLDIVTAMMEDLIAVHQGRYFHIGGDEVRLLGVNPQSEARAKQLGGRAALYLEYVGKVCRYLVARQKLPLVWDDMFRKMSDEQIKWLPPEVALTFWQYEGQGGRATPSILTNLDRYRKLQRRIWGAATRLPAARYDGFDNVGAWTEAAELGYVEGLITTTWTRDHHHGPMFAAPETTWAPALYAAERKWSGMHRPGQRGAPAREQLPDRLVMRMFGMRDSAWQARIWAGVDAMHRDHFRRAREYFAHDPKAIVRNRDILAFWEVWAALGSFKEYVHQFDEYISGNFANLQAGKGDPFHCGRLRWRVADAKQRLPMLVRAFTQRASKITHPGIVQEYLDSTIAYHLKHLDDMESLLSSYPLPAKEWQQPVGI